MLLKITNLQVKWSVRLVQGMLCQCCILTIVFFHWDTWVKYPVMKICHQSIEEFRHLTFKKKHLQNCYGWCGCILLINIPWRWQVLLSFFQEKVSYSLDMDGIHLNFGKGIQMPMCRHGVLVLVHEPWALIPLSIFVNSL